MRRSPAAGHCLIVADTKTLKLLLVEDDLEDEQLLSEALTEIEEQRQWCNWRSSTIVHVEQLADALDCLRQDWFDAVLLNLSLPDSPVLLDTFLEVNPCSRGAPIVVLADEPDENLANRLLREGAQDVLVKSELDCGPLARSLRYAIERQRRSKLLQSSPFVDDLTGALTPQGFLTIAEHYAELSRQNRAKLIFSSIEIYGKPKDREAGDLLLLRAAETLRTAFGSSALLGRLALRRFGLLTSSMMETTVESVLKRAANEIGATSVRFSVSEIAPAAALDQWLNCDCASKTAMLAD